MNGDILLQFTPESTKGTDPPPTDMFFSNRVQVQGKLLDTLRIGLAVAFAWAIMFLLISFIVAASGAAAVLSFFELVYPGFSVGAFAGILLGVLWSFVYGFIFGLLLGIFYNSLIEKSAMSGESYELYG